MITGRLDFLIKVIASLTASIGGAISKDVILFFGLFAFAPVFAGRSCTSSGKVK